MKITTSLQENKKDVIVLMKIAASAEKFQEILHDLQQLKSGREVDLRPSLPILIAAIESVMMLFELLSTGGRIVEVRRLFGFTSVREKNSVYANNDNKDKNCNSPANNDGNKVEKSNLNVQPSSNDSDGQKKLNPNHNGKASVNDYPESPICVHTHDTLKPGDQCPSCGRGKLYFGTPRQRLIFQGQPPITPVRHMFRDLFCSLCKDVFRVSPPQHLADDGLGKVDRYGYSAISMITMMKFFSMLPYYRLGRLASMLGVHVAPSTQFDQVEKVANTFAPVQILQRDIASQGQLLMTDDASNKILSKKTALIPRRSTGKMQLRDGCHSSVAIAFDDLDEMTVLIKTDIIHAGEWLDQILAARNPSLAKPKVMWDRVSSNTITVCDYVDLACNQHARQNFKDLEDQMPKIIRPILNAYKRIFFNDVQTANLSKADRLSYHQTHSQSVFNSIVSTSKKVLSDKLVTENSELGQAFQYVLNHEKALSGFLKYEGAPVSNNLVERVILNIVLMRRASHFFRTPESAAIADTILSVGLTAFFAGVNLYHYFRLGLKHAEEVGKEPERWLPANFLKRYPEYKIKHKSRAGSWPLNSATPYIPLQPPR